MIELPESRTLAGQLTETVAGKKITEACAGHTPHGFAFYMGDPAGYGALLEGNTVDHVESAGGQVELCCGKTRLLFNDGVNLRYLEPGRLLPARYQMHLRMEDGSALVCSVQMYGGMHAFLENTNDSFYYRVAKEKPDPLGGEFDEAYFDRLWKQSKPTLSAKAFLATEQRIPGLGNGVAQDILFYAGVHPKSRLSALGDKGEEKLFLSVRQTLERMTAGGGRDTEKDLFGNPGGYAAALSAKTFRYPCPGCGSPLVKQAYLGGTVYFCPVCQPLES